MTRRYTKRKLTRDHYLKGDPHANNKSGFRGVAYVAPSKNRKAVRYRAELQYNGQRYLGTYRETPELAYNDYKDLVFEYIPDNDLTE